MRRYLRAALIGAALLPSAGLGSDTAVRSADRPSSTKPLA